MDHLLYELNKEFRQDRLREAEKERMLNQFHQGAGFDLPQKILNCLRELLTKRARLNLQHPGQAVSTKHTSHFTFHVLRFISNRH